MPGQIFDPIEMIQKLVSFDTTSRDSNLALIDFVADYLQGHGIVHVSSLIVSWPPALGDEWYFLTGEYL